MTETGMSEIGMLLRNQHEAITELIDIALAAVRESRDSSVGAIHLTTRLNKLADSVKRSASGVALLAPRPATARR